MAKVNKKQFPDIPKCAYAGDEADEYCSQCNGVTMVVDGEEFSCKECQSYMEPEPVKEEEPAAPSESHETPRDDTFGCRGNNTLPVCLKHERRQISRLQR